ncbi:MAG: bifunctional UDP-N-acetylglucosamine diphosphorylase/glucosamine-1-phosphate N-acetyltransferase GlmU, partial [Rhizobiales bacterium]|nr:bifunctional UDP-N-acetylglucosamine diphosphorylase/glucosamine-1-phosphate N-acetyltransferase GlmU [Hyphomicrobiales bacterium]
MSEIAIIVLAAGLGTRMRSELPKVLHKAAGRSLLGHVLTAARELNPARCVVVCGPGKEDLSGEAKRHAPGAEMVTQAERRGTGHAVSMAESKLKDFTGTILILYGDVPLIEAATLSALAEQVGDAQPLAVLGFEAANPKGYGRLLRGADGSVKAIREELDASPEERLITLCNSGILAVDAGLLWRLLAAVRPNNAKGEIYLTDIAELCVAEGRRVGLSVCPEQQVQGVNTRAQLARIEAILQERYRALALDGGATMIAPDTIFFSADTRIGHDVVIEPFVVFGPGVTVGNNVHILAFSHIEGASIEAGARIGPFARLRPGAEIGEDVHIGNFVEVKKARVDRGAKANHLSYIGDAHVGAGSNVGAGTITANYDGFDKHHTEIGAGV